MRGGLLGEMFGHSAPNGAKAGAIAGGTRHTAQKVHSYNYCVPLSLQEDAAGQGMRSGR